MAIIDMTGVDPTTLLKSKPATQASVRAVDNNPKNAAAIASAKTTSANAKTRSQAAKSTTPAANRPDMTPVSTVRMSYPSELPVYFMQLLFVPYSREIAFENAKKKHTYSISLPMPAALNEAFGLKYNTISVGPFVEQIMEGVSEAITTYQKGSTLGTALSTSITNKIKQLSNNSSDVLGAGFSRLAGGVSETAGSLVDMTIGTTPNPSLAVAFNGVGLRSFTYSWKFAPWSSDESAAILNIIAALKRLTLPEKNLLTLKYPHYVDVVLHPDSLNNIIKYKTCVINDVRVNWAPNGVPSFFAGTQVPTEIELTLSFQETKIFTSEDFSESVVLKNGKATGGKV